MLNLFNESKVDVAIRDMMAKLDKHIGEKINDWHFNNMRIENVRRELIDQIEELKRQNKYLLEIIDNMSRGKNQQVATQLE